jgi:glycosyltransferase involved in cell wall biosynthesis
LVIFVNASSINGQKTIVMSTQPKVSILVVCYNHAKFLRQCLDSIIVQKTNHPFEVLIADDASTDGSQEIIKEYHARYPELITTVLLHKKSFGDYGKSNCISIEKEAKGKYLNILEGDDYWIDEHKLQLQIDLLDQHPETVICFHNALITYEDGSLPSHEVNPVNQKAHLTANDLIGETEIWFMATASVMYRNGILYPFPAWFYKSKSGDIPRYILLTKKGDIRYINRTMSVYRKHSAGLSYSDHKHDAGFLWNRIEMYQSIDNELGLVHHAKIQKNIARYYLMMANSKQYNGHWFWEAFYALKHLRMAQPSSKERIKQVLLDHVMPHSLMNVYAFVKGKIVG